MKKLTLILACFIFVNSAHGQDLIERISNSICGCVDTIENMDSLQSKIDRCVPESMALYFNSDEDTDNHYFSNVDTIKNTIDMVMQSLLYYCPKIKEFILADREEQYYQMSASETANQYYTDASDALGSKDYRKAEKGFIKAIKEDPEWVLPFG